MKDFARLDANESVYFTRQLEFVKAKTYDTIYQERYMGLPSQNKDGYYDGSPINHASKLQGNLLIMHGTADDNVHYQSFEMLVDELIKYNKLQLVVSYR